VLLVRLDLDVGSTIRAAPWTWVGADVRPVEPARSDVLPKAADPATLAVVAARTDLLVAIT
jgi:hypothetical protein